MRRLLDTSAYSSFKRGHLPTLDLIRQSTEVILPAIVAGELIAGFRWGARYQTNYDELKQFIANPGVRFVSANLATADHYGQIYSNLRRQGTPIPTNDMWIAAHAIENAAELVTLDRHFQNIDDLSLSLIDI